MYLAMILLLLFIVFHLAAPSSAVDNITILHVSDQHVPQSIAQTRETIAALPSGVKFIAWDTTTPQDPRPSIGEEGLRWLTAQFERTPAHQPVIFFGHHPLDAGEFAGPYDCARLLNLLHSRNVVLMAVGHGAGERPGQGVIERASPHGTTRRQIALRWQQGLTSSSPIVLTA